MTSLEKPRTSRKLLGKWRNCRKEHVGKGLKKRHEMEERQSFEKIRNIEASILKKLRIRSSTESSVRWSSEQDSLQGDEWYRGRSGKGLQSKDKCDKKGTCRQVVLFSLVCVFLSSSPQVSPFRRQTWIIAYATATFLRRTKKIPARGWLSSPLLRSAYLSYLVLSCLVFSYLSIYPSIHLSIYRSIDLSIYPSIHLSI